MTWCLVRSEEKRLETCCRFYLFLKVGGPCGYYYSWEVSGGHFKAMGREAEVRKRSLQEGSHAIPCSCQLQPSSHCVPETHTPKNPSSGPQLSPIDADSYHVFPKSPLQVSSEVSQIVWKSTVVEQELERLSRRLLKPRDEGRHH